MGNKAFENIEKELAKKPKYATFFLLKNWLAKQPAEREAEKGFFKSLFDDFKTGMAGLFDTKAVKDMEATKAINAGIAKVAESVDGLKASNEAKSDKGVKDAIESMAEGIKDEIRKKELSVKVDAPKVTVEAPQVIIPAEDQKKTNGLLELLFAKLSAISGTVRIANNTPEDAIPVVLANSERKKFYDAFQSIIAGGGGGGGARAVRVNDENGHPITATNPLPVTQRQEYAVKWTSATDFNKGTNFNTAVTGSGDDAYVGLATLDDNSDNVPFTDPADYTFDTAKIEVAGGEAKLKLASGAEKNWDYSTPADYTYNASKIKVDGGLAKLFASTDIDTYAHWHLNESSGAVASDSSGNARNGTLVNMEDADWGAGKLNNCLTFNGGGTTDEKVDCGSIANWERTQPFSFECWFKTTGTATQFLATRRLGSGIFRGMSINLESGNKIGLLLISDLGTANWLNVYVQPCTYNDGNWHHCVWTYNGNSLASGVKMYFDGVSKTVLTWADSLTGTIQSVSPFILGADNRPNFNFVGSMDEVVLYEKELSVSEVGFRYNTGTGIEDTHDFNTTNKPSIYNSVGLPFTASFITFTETATKPATTEIKYQLSFNDGVTWKWWDGVGWVAITGGQTEEWYYTNEANTASDVNTNISTIASSGTLRVKAFFHTSAVNDTPKLSNVYVATDLVFPIGSFTIEMDTDIKPSVNWGYLSTTETVTKPANTDIKYQFSVNSGSTYNGAWLTESELESALQAITCAGDGNDKVRFKFQLTTTVNTTTPKIDNLNIVSSQGYHTSGTYESNVYASSYLSLDWENITWSVTLPSGATAVFKCKAGNSNPIIESYGSALVNGADSNATGKYFQWKVELTGNGNTSPQVSDFLVKYFNPLLNIQAP